MKMREDREERDGGERRTGAACGMTMTFPPLRQKKSNNISSGRTSRDSPTHSGRRAEEGGGAGLMGEGDILI
ncbi:hypothetical protein PBY51_014879 [Eleginops maclovinus]|uniref:Uncharacterized protein n=1 Tax=Eleginops maclovinus TaxID=56733 RepID=A0AAN8AFY2_ELEMC|nr:hypothetical protein PBY51_014879 [Eleginops maclovinus]